VSFLSISFQNLLGDKTSRCLIWCVLVVLLYYFLTPSNTLGNSLLSDIPANPFQRTITYERLLRARPAFYRFDTVDSIFILGCQRPKSTSSTVNLTLHSSMAYRTPNSSPSGSRSPSSTTASTDASPASHPTPLTPVSMVPSSEERETQSSQNVCGSSSRLSIDPPRSQSASKGGCWCVTHMY
jgi:hypothetical protein